MTSSKNDNCQDTTESVTVKALSSLKWSALMEVVSRTAQPLIFIVLARLLTPADFGVLATGMIVISFAQMFWDAGLSRALIQTKEDIFTAADVVFWVNLTLGMLIYIITYLTAPLFAILFNSPDSFLVLRVLGIQIIISSLYSVQQTLFIREMDFRSLFWIKLITALIPGLLSISLALYNYGVWALVWGAIAGQVLNLYLIWHKSQWRPRIHFNIKVAQQLFVFGIWVIGESLTAWFYGWGDNLLVGAFLGIDDLGSYRVGWSVISIIFGLALNPFISIAYPTFCNLQNNMCDLKKVFLKTIKVASAVSLPIATGLLVLSPLFVSVFFGEKWKDISIIVSIMGFMYGFMGFIAINSELYRAIGRPDINTKLNILFVIVYLPVYLIFCPLGLEIFTYARMCLGFFTFILHIYIAVRILNLSLFYIWNNCKKIIIATILMGLSLKGLEVSFTYYTYQPHNIIKLGFLIFVGTFIYAATLWILDRSFIINIRKQIVRAIKE